MKVREIRLQLRSIRAQLEALEAELAKLAEKEGRLRFEDLEGIWEGKADFSFEEIKAAEYKIKELPQ